ncbi:MAG: hypothetical protein ACOCUS_02490 [Polyangiales bacterium]
MGSFHRYATSLTYRHAKVLAVAAGVWVLALWPLDAVLYGPEAPVERALGLWRAGTLGAVVGVALLLGLLSRRGRDPFALLAITITASQSSPAMCATSPVALEPGTSRQAARRLRRWRVLAVRRDATR